MMTTDPADVAANQASFRKVRTRSEALCAPLEPEDFVIQSMADTSPPKWHLAHTTWFFETFLLEPYEPGYQPFDASYRVLFNSYYESVGQQHARPQRGLLSRPSIEKIRAYRRATDERVLSLMETLKGNAEWMHRLATGLHHEQQHQELLLMDIKHNLFANPLGPAYRTDLPEAPHGETTPLRWQRFDGGVQTIGHDGDGFAFCNEGPRHDVLLQPYDLANRLVTCGEWLDFMSDGGYQRHELWLSDGWATVKQRGWNAPLYWRKEDDTWRVFSLSGFRPIRRDEPVVHISYFEAAAFAAWRNARLPTEAEWEHAVNQVPVTGNFADADLLHPAPSIGSGLSQCFGDVWEHTQSPYVGYPGYRPPAGALGEYNGKFMCGQWVLRGGSCVTPEGHTRPTYRNFFYPDQRWNFQGMRLARTP